MVIRISTEQLNVNDIMNNEPPLILISKQLLIVYEATSRRSREGDEGKEGNWKKKKGKRDQARRKGKEKHNRCNVTP